MADTLDQVVATALREVLEVTPNAIGIFDKSLTLLYCNDVLANLFCMTKAEAIGLTQEEILKESFETSKGINLETEDFDTWYQELNCAQKQTNFNQFEADSTEGTVFKMTRITLDSGLMVMLGTDITELKQTQSSLELALTKVELMANTDQLTGVYNRRYFEDIAQKEIERCVRYQQTFSLLVLDLDYFKNINDKYGHHVGDEVLIHFTSICQRQLRLTDTLCRIGGEEFSIVLPSTHGKDALQIAERIRDSVSTTDIPLDEENNQLTITVSIGVTEYRRQDLAISDTLVRADKALYRCKEIGRNNSLLI